jgi:hypothetical protein
MCCRWKSHSGFPRSHAPRGNVLAPLRGASVKLAHSVDLPIWLGTAELLVPQSGTGCVTTQSVRTRVLAPAVTNFLRNCGV